jgi:hypothetical protein
MISYEIAKEGFDFLANVTFKERNRRDTPAGFILEWDVCAVNLSAAIFMSFHAKKQSNGDSQILFQNKHALRI